MSGKLYGARLGGVVLLVLASGLVFYFNSLAKVHENPRLSLPLVIFMVAVSARLIVFGQRRSLAGAAKAFLVASVAGFIIGMLPSVFVVHNSSIPGVLQMGLVLTALGLVLPAAILSALLARVPFFDGNNGRDRKIK